VPGFVVGLALPFKFQDMAAVATLLAVLDKEGPVVAALFDFPEFKFFKKCLSLRHFRSLTFEKRPFHQHFFSNALTG
jgi:hypothetical protein